MTTLKWIVYFIQGAFYGGIAYYISRKLGKERFRLKFLQDQIVQLREQVSMLTGLQAQRDLAMEDMKKKTGDLMIELIKRLMELPETVREGVRKEMNDIISKMP